MKRSELTQGIDEIGTTLKETGLVNLLSELMQASDGDDRSKKLLKALKDYAFKAQDFSPAARRVADLMDLQDLEDSDTWLILMGDVEEEYVADKLMRIRVIRDLLPLLAVLIQKDPELFAEMSALLGEIENEGEGAHDEDAGEEALESTDAEESDAHEETAEEILTDEDQAEDQDDDEMTRLFKEHIQSE